MKFLGTQTVPSWRKTWWSLSIWRGLWRSLWGCFLQCLLFWGRSTMTLNCVSIFFQQYLQTQIDNYKVVLENEQSNQLMVRYCRCLWTLVKSQVCNSTYPWVRTSHSATHRARTRCYTPVFCETALSIRSRRLIRKSLVNDHHHL